MGLHKEIWLNSVVGNLFPDNTFAIRSANHSAFVTNKTVHVPNAGAKPGVTKNRDSYPATVQTRSDNELTYDIAEFTTDPFRVPNAESVELSYDKRESIISASRSALVEAIHNSLIRSWVPSGYTVVKTTGESTTAHIGTGNRKLVTIADILAVKKEFDKNDVPATGRCFLLDAEMYDQLLGALTTHQADAFLATADAKKGTVGTLYGFDFYMRSSVLRTVAACTSLAAEGSTTVTDSAAGIAWQADCVARAQGESELFEQANDPTYYADVFSMLVRAGGSYCRYDKKGVVILAQDTPA